MNKLIILNGIPGSGKTSIGNLLADKNDFKFVKIDTFYENLPRVDESVPWYKDDVYKNNVYRAFEESIKSVLSSGNVVIESTGIGDKFNNMVDRLKKENIQLIKILLKVDEQTARKRVDMRNNTNYPIKVSLDDMDHYISHIPVVEEQSDFVVDANRNLEDIYLEICNKLKL